MALYTIAELAQRKSDLIAELQDVNAEIASRAGEVDPPGTPAPDDTDGYVTVRDEATQRAADEAARTIIDALTAAKASD